MACVKSVGNYDVYADENHLLGRGAMGSVYTGVDRTSRVLKRVAAKEIEVEADACEDESVYHQEADLLLNIIPPHENVIKIYDFK